MDSNLSRSVATVQVLNVLMLKDLVEYLLESDLQHVRTLNLSELQVPQHLSMRILPAELRQLAINRLAEARQACRQAETERGIMLDVNLEEMMRVLEEPEPKNADTLRQEFQRTNFALDKHRAERLLEVVPDLAPLAGS